MKKRYSTSGDSVTKKGYNEKNPGQPQGAFPPDAAQDRPGNHIKSTKADKKAKEDAP